MRVLVAGASGTLGGPLLRRLRAEGHRVTGIVRSLDAAAIVRERGAEVIAADVLDREALLRATAGARFDAVVHELTALKRPPLRHSAMTETDTLRTSGSVHLLEVAQATGATRFVTQSIVFGYGYRDHRDALLTEQAPFGEVGHDRFAPHVAAMAAAENLAFGTPGVEGVALRYGLFYGADLAAMERMLRRRALPVVRGGGAIPFVHHDDAASATVAALERGAPGNAYNVVGDDRVSFSDVIRMVAAARSTPKPVVVPPWVLAIAAPYGAALYSGVSMRVANRKARDDLGWEPRYPTVADGLR